VVAPLHSRIFHSGKMGKATVLWWKYYDI